MCQPLCSVAKQTCKNAQLFFTSEKTLPTRLLAQKSKRHRSPNLENHIPNKITCSEIKEAPLPELREVGFHWIKCVHNPHTQHQFSRYHRPLFQSALTKLKHVNLAATTTLLWPRRVKEQHYHLLLGQFLYMSTSILHSQVDLPNKKTYAQPFLTSKMALPI